MFCLFLDEPERVPIRVADCQSPSKCGLTVAEFHASRRSERELTGPHPSFGILYVGRTEVCLPLEQVAGAGIGGIGTAVSRGDVFEELDARTRRRTKRRDSQPSPKHVVQMLLLDAVVFALSQ